MLGAALKIEEPSVFLLKPVFRFLQAHFLLLHLLKRVLFYDLSCDLHLITCNFHPKQGCHVSSSFICTHLHRTTACRFVGSFEGKKLKECRVPSRYIGYILNTSMASLSYPQSQTTKEKDSPLSVSEAGFLEHPHTIAFLIA